MKKITSVFKGAISVLLLVVSANINSYGQCSVSAGNDTTICQNKPFVRTATVAPAGATIQWYLQGNSSNTLSTIAAVNTVPPSSGVFFYIIKVSSGTGASACTEFDTVKVTVNPSPRINAGSTQNTCQGGLLSLTATVVPSSATLNWYLLGSTTSLGTNATYSVPTTTAGTFDYVVKADSASTCSSFDTVRVVVNPKPVANFTFTSNCGRKYQFNSTSTTAGGSITNYQWTFSGTGTNNYSSTSNQQNPNNNFPRGSSGQTFNIRLIVTNSFGCKDTVTQNTTIGSSPFAQLASDQPTTEINGDEYFFVCTSGDSTFTFYNNSSNYNSGTTYTINWGDGTSNSYNQTTFPAPLSSGVSVAHNYLTGIYTLSFIMNNAGCIDSVRYKVYVGNIPAGGIVGLAGSTICAGSQQGVVISGTTSNTAGTIYTLTYNDGTAPITLTAPIPDPDTLFHRFDTTSCGTNSTTGGNTFPNAFGAYLTIQSPCGTRAGSVVPIYVASAPVADFTYTPYDSICVGQTMTFNNTSIAGQNNVNGTCTPGKVVWQITPSTPGTRYVVTSGSFGAVVTANPTNWTSGSNALNVRFDSAGVYTIRIIAANNQLCGSDTMIKTICVNPTPTAAFTLSPNIGCAPLRVNASGSTNTPNCGVNTYRWTVSYAPTNGCVPNAIDFAYVNGTSATSQNPQFSFISPGVYTIGLQTFSPRDRCSSAVVTQTVTVKGKPVVTINLTDNTVCVNEPITPTKTDTCFIDASTTYAWTFPSGTPTTSNNPSPGSITYANAGTYNIGLTVTNVCGSTPATASVTINPLPTVTGTLSVCIGQTTTLTGTSTATGSGTWTSDNNGIATVSSTGVVTGQTAGTTTITFTDGNGCKKAVTVTVNPLPTITGNAAICVGSNLTLTGSATAATINPWVSASTGVATISNTGVVTAVSAGTSIITYTNSNGCKSEVTFTVNPLPSITGDTVICLNNTSQLSGSPTAATNNPWVSSTPAIATVTNGGLVSAFSVGTTIITYTNTNGCTKKVTVIVKTLPVISGSSSICVGSNVSFSASTNPSATTPWTSSNTSVATVSNTGAVIGVAAGQSTITYTNEFGCQATFLVTVSSSPTATISYPSTVCTNQTNQNVTLTGATGGTFSLTPVGTTGLSLNTSTGAINPSTSTAGNYTVNYNIPAGNGCSAVNVNTTVTITNTPAAPAVTSPVVYCQNVTSSALTATPTGTNSLLFYTASTGGTGTTSLSPPTTAVGSITYYVSQVTPSGCEGPRAPITVTVNPLPTITGNAAICVGSNLTLTGSATAATINPWVSASTGVATISNTGVVTAVSAGTSIITYTNSNGCKSEVTFTVNPLPSITGDTVICLNNTSQLSGSPTAATNNPWVSSTPAIATVTNGGLVSAQSVGTTIITYTNNNGCVKTRTVIVKTLPVISGSSSICVGSNVSFSASTNPSATTPWTSSNTSVATVSNTGAVIGVAAGQSTITYTNEFGCQATFLVTVSSSPTATISYPSTVCTNQTNQNVTLTGATGGTFSLTPVGTTGLSLNTSTGAINPSTSTAGNYTVNYNIPAGNGCPAVNVVTNVTITNTPAAPIPSGNNTCSGNTLQLNTSFTGTGTPVWNWTGPNGFSSSNEDPSITNVSVSASGTYSVTVTINNCTSAPNTVNIVIDSTPPRPRATSNSPLCTDSTLVLQSTLSSTISVSWLWTGPGGFVSHQQDTTRSNVVLADSGYYYITATATYASSGLTCPSKRDSVRVIITKTPKITTFSSSNPTQCNTRTGSITIHGLTAGSVYTVHYSNNGVDTVLNNVTAVGDSIVIGNLAAGTYTNVYVVSSSGCPSNSVGSFALVDPNPPAPPSPSSNSPICSGGTLTLTASTTAQGVPTYLWSGPGISTGTTGSTITITNASTWQAGTYNVSVTINNCRSRDTSLLVVIDSTPPRPRATSNSPLCTDSILVLQSTLSSTIPVSWLWTGPGGFVSHQQDTTRSSAVLADSGYYYVTATATYASSGLSCPSKRDSVRVIITKTPKITTFSSSDPTQCNTRTGTITIHGLTAGAVYTVHYSNNGVDTVLNNVTAVGDSIVISNLAAGTYTNVYVVSSSGCPSNSVGSFSLEDPSPPPAPNTSNGGPICDGESLQLNASTNESGTPTWNWTGPNSFSSVLQNPLINPATLVNAGVYSVTVTINNCTSIPGTTTAIVNPRPLAPLVNSPVVYCQYDIPTALTATALSGHTLNWYPTATGGTASSTAPTPSAANAGAVDYYVSQTTPDNCEGPRSLITVIVNPTPVVGNVATTICSGASFNIIPTGTGVDATTVYSWSAPVVTGGLTGGAAANGETSLNGLLSNPTDFIQTATYTITPKTGDCQGNTFTLIVTVNPAPRVIFSQSDQAVCSGGTTTTVQLTSPTPNVNIPWTTSVPAGINGVVPSGANTIPAQTLINNTATPLVVTYAAVAINSGTFSCPGDTTRYFITVNPTPSIHDTAFVICSGQPFSLTPVNNQPYNIVPINTSYTWQVSNNGSMTGQTDTTNTSSLITQSSLINTTNTPQTLVYTVIPVSGDAGNCPGNPFTITVTINPAPAFPTMYDTICSGGSFDTIPVNNPPFIVPAGTLYTWSVPTMPSGNGGQTSGGQAQTDQTQIFGTLSNTSYEPLNVVYSVTPSSGNASGSACAGAPFNYIVTVNPLSSISNNPSNQSVCNNNATLPVDWTSFTAGSTYSWTLVSSGTVTGFLPAGAGPTLGTMTLINTGVAQDSVVYLVSSTANACAGPAKPYTIYVNPDAKASFIPVKDTACWPFQITSDTLVNNSPQTADSAYLWYVDNVFIGSGYVFPGYTISASDTFVDIKLVTISRYGCVNDSTTHRFYTYNDPKPSFALTYSNPPCGPLTVTFQNQTMNFTPNPIAPFNYHWDFGNGNTSNDQNPLPQIYPANPTFNDTTYFVTLTVSNQCISRDTTIEVTVKAPPRARFAPAATNVCSNAVLQFNNTSLGIGNTYQWIFGDGSPTVTSNNLLPVQHIYNTGVDTTFYAVLIATNECGVDYDTVAIRVTPSSIRLNWYIVAPTQYGCSPHTVQIVNVSRGATQFEWNFNDPNSPGIYTSGLNSEVIFHTYTTPGIYTINVKALNACTDTTDLDSVRVIRSPIPNISILNNYSCTNTAVQFDNLTDTATRYLWNFGDPASGVRDTSTLENPSHFYNTEGVYIVTLTATLNDISGVICSSQKTDTVRIVKPIVQINAPTTGCIKDSIVFIPIVNSVLGLATITDTIWQINGVPYQTSGSGQSNFVHVFTQPGTYNITLIVGTASGCYDTARTSIVVNIIPSITGSNDQRICLGNSVQLLAISNAGNYQWTPLSGLNCYTCPNPIASPTITTPYVVSTINNFGCKNTDTVLVTVIQPFEITASPSDTICIGESTVLSVSGAYRYIWSPAATLSCISCPNPTANPTITTNYMVVGFDNYNCFTDTAKMSVVVGGYPNVTLPPDQTLSTGTLFPIISQSTNGPIRTYSWSPSQDLSCADCPTPVAYIKKDVCYVLNATNIYGCSGEDTMCIKVFCENGQVFIPNTFTPDNDGINDKFLVRGKGIKSIKHFRVFNRWGEIVFERNDFPPNQPSFGWDGKVRGVLSTPDVYVYTAEVVCENDVLFTYKGNVTVIR